MAQETLEETQRRLGLSTAPVKRAGVTIQTPQYAPRPTASKPPINGKGAARIFTVLAGVAVLGIIGYNVFSTMSDGPSIFADDWEDYPGSYYVEADDVLANDSLETLSAEGDELMLQLQAALVEYGFEWTVDGEGSIDRTTNGYEGDSMLYNYQSDTLLGQASLDDPDARADIMAIFNDIMTADPGTTVVISNDSITDEDAAYYFGSEDRDQQALWSAWTYDENYNSLEADIDIFDSTVAVDDEFDGAYWVPDDSSSTFFVRLNAYAYDLLSEDDRDAFVDALEPYEGREKPDYRG